MTAKEKKNLRVFGYGLGIIISFFVWRHGAKHGGIGFFSYAWLGLAAVLAGITAINLEAIRPLYKYWMKGAHFIGNIISGIILAVLYFFVFGIVGIVTRIFKIDLLDQKLNKEASSYWHERERKPFDQKSYKYQF